MNTCPYCKINFNEHPWAKAKQPKIICDNCKRYYDNTKAEQDFPIKVIAEWDPIRKCVVPINNLIPS